MKYSFITLFCLQTGSYCVHHMVQVIPLPQSPKTLGKGGHHCVSLFWGERRAVVVKKLSFMKRTCSKVLCRLLKTETTMPTCYFQDVGGGVSCEQELTYWHTTDQYFANANPMPTIWVLDPVHFVPSRPSSFDCFPLTPRTLPHPVNISAILTKN